MERADKQASKELNSLADLIRPSAVKEGNFKLNLFNESSGTASNGDGGGGDSVIAISRIITIEGNSGNKARSGASSTLRLKAPGFKIST